MLDTWGSQNTLSPWSCNPIGLYEIYTLGASTWVHQSSKTACTFTATTIDLKADSMKPCCLPFLVIQVSKYPILPTKLAENGWKRKDFFSPCSVCVNPPPPPLKRVSKFWKGQLLHVLIRYMEEWDILWKQWNMTNALPTTGVSDISQVESVDLAWGSEFHSEKYTQHTL